MAYNSLITSSPSSAAFASSVPVDATSFKPLLVLTSEVKLTNTSTAPKFNSSNFTRRGLFTTILLTVVPTVADVSLGVVGVPHRLMLKRLAVASLARLEVPPE
jgi:hypothetical protein